MLGGLLRPHRRAVLAYGGALAVATSLPLLASILLARFLDRAVTGAPATALVRTALAYAAIGLVASAVTVVVSWRATSLAWRITDTLRRDLAGQVLRADIGFHRDRTPGELVTRVDADVTAMTQFLAQVVSRVISIVALAIAALAVCAVLQPVLAPVLAVGLAVIGTVTWTQRNSANEVTLAERAAEADLMSVTEQYLSGAEDIAALGAGAHGVARVADASEVKVQTAGARRRTQMRVQGSIRVSIVSAEILMIGCGALAARRGWVTLAGVFLGYRFLAVIRQPLEGLTWRLQEAQGASGAATRVLQLLEESRAEPGGDATLPAGGLDIHFGAVDLIYDDADDDEAAVEELSVQLRAGRSVGLVGRSGSGKTSVARLALRLVGPTRGTLTVGGMDLASIAEADLRRRVSAVPQDVQLFPGTVADNVTLFADRDEPEIAAALEQVGLGPWLAGLRDGLHTRLASDGRDDGERAGLSAGEAQLLALARALLRRPDVVVLDEATSRVDPITQAAIEAATASLVEGRTAIIIAHRLETLDRCDDIAVLDDGRLVEFGPRDQLAADPTSRYARLLATARAGHDTGELAS